MNNLHYLCRESKFILGMNKEINRIKIILVEKHRTGKWLAERLHKDPTTVSKWCTNSTQPQLETLLQIAGVLDCDIKDLLISTKL